MDAGLWWGVALGIKRRRLSEIIISDGPTRTVFGNFGERMKRRIWNKPSKRLMRQARIVCLDPALGAESVAAGRMARSLGLPYVTLDRPLGDELGREAAALRKAKSRRLK